MLKLALLISLVSSVSLAYERIQNQKVFDFVKNETESTEGLSSLLKASDDLLKNQIPNIEYENIYKKTLSSGFGQSHRQLIQDILNKKGSLFSQDFNCAFDSEKCENLSLISLSDFIESEPKYEIIIVNSEIFSAESFANHPFSNIDFRFVFVDSEGSHTTYVGKPTDLLKSVKNKKSIDKDKSEFEIAKQILPRDKQPSWLEKNKSWVVPLTVLLGAFAVYEMKDKILVIEK